ncbi:hypothetical protein GCM10009100_40050 [Thalassospira tepidiphila]
MGQIGIDIKHKEPVKSLGTVGMSFARLDKGQLATAHFTPTPFNLHLKLAELGNDDLVEIAVAMALCFGAVLPHAVLHRILGLAD